jgi:predicted component of type VI protein secretion system
MTRKHGKKEIRKRLENDRLEYKEETESTGPVEKVLVRKKRKRLPSLERLRHELVYQLRESLRASQEKMNNPELSLAERHHWTQIHTYTAQVLNTILRDLQLKDWEKRLKELEQRGLTYKTLPSN